ncbi:MAG: SMC-Scp complex subunit ScpB [Candidatus Binataceae bacterium]
MDEERLKSILESLLLAAGEPVSITRIAGVLEGVPKAEIQNGLVTLGAQYSANNRGLAIEEVAGGYQLRTPKEHAQYVRRLLATRPPRLSRPLLETVAIIAYRQPITRPEIEQLRGVDTGGVLETLLERRIIKIAGRKEGPGRPMMYATTPEFLEVFGLKDLESLPDLKEFQEIERAVEQTTTGPIESVETHPEDALPAEDVATAAEESALAGAESIAPSEPAESETTSSPEKPDRTN